MRIIIALLRDQKKTQEHLKNLIHKHATACSEPFFESVKNPVQKLPFVPAPFTLVDIQLPRDSCMHLMADLKPFYKLIQFIILTAYEDNECLFQTLRKNIKNVPNKTPEALKNPNLESPWSHANRINHPHTNVATLTEKNEALEKLSIREKAILSQLSRGLRYKEIAALLFISTETVRTHIRNIYSKLDVNSRTEALNKVFLK